MFHQGRGDKREPRSLSKYGELKSELLQCIGGMDRQEQARLQGEMHRKIDAAIEGIPAATEKGLTQKTKGEQAIVARKKALVETMGKLDIIGGRLNSIRARAGGGLSD